MKLGFIKEFCKILGKLGLTIVFFSLFSAIGIGTGHELIGLIGLLYLFGISTRLLCTYSDAIKDLECVSSSALMLAWVAGPWIAAIYGFTCLWLSNIVSPWGKAEDLQYVFMDALAIFGAALVVPLLTGFFNFQIITIMFWFYIIRFIIYLVQIPFVKAATMPTSFFLTFIGFFIAITQAYVVIYFIGPMVLDAFGITGWTFGTMPLLEPFK